MNVKKILLGIVVCILLIELAQAPYQTLIQNCVGTPQCFDKGATVACTCAQVNASDNTYAAGTGLESQNGASASITANLSQNSLPSNTVNVSAAAYVEWNVQASGTCSVEAYNGSAWTTLSTACQTTEALYSYSASAVDTKAEAEQMEVRVNYTITAGKKSLYVDHVYVNVSYNRRPNITAAAADGSNSTTPTVEPNNVVFTITAIDDDADSYQLLVCDASGQANGACTGTQICKSGTTASGAQASCSHATTGESGSYSWRAYACDTNSACTEDGNGNSPYNVDKKPTITVAASDGSSSSTTPTQEPGNVVFTINATDPEEDQYKLLVCDSSGQSGGACAGTQYCASGFTNTSVQATCSHATTGKSGSYTWRAFACDNQSACVEDGNTASPFYVNNEPTWASVSKDASTKKYGDTVTMTSSGAGDSEGDTLRLECGSASGAYNLCAGTYGSGERICSFSSQWNDNANHIIYCALNDSFSHSTELNDTVTSYTQPSVYLTSPANNSNKSSTTVSFTWTVKDDGDATLSCNLTVDGSVNKTGISASNSSATTEAVSGFSEGAHNWAITCSDAGGYTATNSTLNFVVDSVKPALSEVSRTPATVGIGGNVTVNATASDVGTGLKGVWANLTYPNGTTTQYAMTSLGSNKYQYNITGAGGGNQTMAKGRYSLKVWTQDWAGNTNSSGELTFDVQASASISVGVKSKTYGASQQVNLTANSWLNNTGTESLSGFLVMKVMRLNGSLEVCACENASTIVDDLAAGTPRAIGGNTVLALDTIWNAAPWSTGSSKDGMYAVYVAFTDAQGDIIYGGNDTELEASDEFSIEVVNLLSGGSVNPSSGNATTLFNYTVTYTSAGNTPPASINATVDGVSYAMAAANASDTDYTDGRLYYYNTTLTCKSHTYSFETSDGTSYDRTNTTFKSPGMNPQVNLAFGWNMISFPLDTTTFTAALSSIAGKYSNVVYWNGVEFASVNLADQVDEDISYWILIDDPAGVTLEFNGQEFSARRKRAFSGGACTGDSCWVSVGLNSVNGKSMDDVMRGMQINVDYKSVVYLNRTDGLFKSYISDPVGNDYNTLKVGLGYYIQIPQGGCMDCVLDYKP
jgi:hypothetical protein